MAVAGALLQWLLSSSLAAAAVAALLLLRGHFRQRRARQRLLAGQLRGQVAFVSGASSGLGRSLAMELGAAGARLVLGGRDLERLRAVQQELPHGAARIVQFDLEADARSLEATATEIWGEEGVDIVVNNAGISYRGAALQTDLKVHERVMRANYFGHVKVTSSLCDLAQRSPSRRLHVVGISSLQGLVSQPYRSAYAASKHAFQAFHDCLRAELGDARVSVLTVSPAYIQTQLSANAVTSSGARYDRTDSSTKSGMSPTAAAKAIVLAIVSGESELLLGPWHYRLAPLLRHLAPDIMFGIMRRRAAHVSRDE